MGCDVTMPREVVSRRLVSSLLVASRRSAAVDRRTVIRDLIPHHRLGIRRVQHQRPQPREAGLEATDGGVGHRLAEPFPFRSIQGGERLLIPQPAHPFNDPDEESQLGLGVVRQVRERVAGMLKMVGLQPELINRYPHEFSGGQCQRIGIARALVVNPRLVVCDEPVSALDVSIQAQIVNLLKELQKKLQLSLIFIAHDLSVVRHVSDRILVMYLGRVMEIASRTSIYDAPAHPYTRALIESVPIPDPEAERERARHSLGGELPSPTDPPSGCVFRTRCPYAIDRCAAKEPPLETPAHGGQVACIRHDDIAEDLRITG